MSFPMAYEDWIKLDEIEPHMRYPFNLPCPNCGESMIYPTSCNCSFEQRVFALAGMADDDANTDRLPRATLIAVNRAMRALDDSSSYPIRNRFNGTERAIRRVRQWMREGGYFDDGLEGYVRAVDHEIGRIVNSL